MGMTNELEIAEELRGVMREILRDHAPTTGAAPTVDVDLPEDLWQVLVEAGLDRLTGSEEAGGGGAGWHEAAVVLEESARHAVSHPYLEHDLLAGWLRETAGLPSMGDAIATVAVLGPDGDSSEVAWLPWAASVVVLDIRDAVAPTVYEVETEGLTAQGRRAINGEARHVVQLPDPGDSARAVDALTVEEFWRRGALGRSIQIAGAAAAVSDLCVDHATERVQFGRPLGRFQAVQHLVTNVAASAAMSRAIVARAVSSAATLGFGDEHTRFLIAAAKSVTGGSVDDLVREAHQVHGAIGTTLEHSLHRFTRPLLAWQREFGSAAEWDARLEAFAYEVGPHGLWELVTR